jgi:hypothetical protein
MLNIALLSPLMVPALADHYFSLLYSEASPPQRNSKRRMVLFAIKLVEWGPFLLPALKSLVKVPQAQVQVQVPKFVAEKQPRLPKDRSSPSSPAPLPSLRCAAPRATHPLKHQLYETTGNSLNPPITAYRLYCQYP